LVSGSNMAAPLCNKNSMGIGYQALEASQS
jgi:hypothetical protein